jgi:hypothetical protein
MRHVSDFPPTNILQDLQKKINNVFLHEEEQQSNYQKMNNAFPFFGEHDNHPEINSVQWDEYGNPYIYLG